MDFIRPGDTTDHGGNVITASHSRDGRLSA